MSLSDYSERFRKAWQLVVIEYEGGAAASNDPNDPGGYTKWGVTQRDHPGLDVRHLTEDQAASVYHEGEWASIRGDALPSDDLAVAIFDIAVNMGVGVAVGFMQNLCYVLGQTHVVDDEHMGPQTLNAIGSVWSTYGSRVLDYLNGEQLGRYYSLWRNNPRLATFKNGWRKRCRVGG